MEYKFYDIRCVYHMPHMSYIPKSYLGMIQKSVDMSIKCRQNVYLSINMVAKNFSYVDY